MIPDFSVILSVSEFRLGLELLGFGQWDDIPMIQTDESLEQRAMNAFLHLIETGRCVSSPEGYRIHPEFRQLLELIGRADRVYRVYEQERIYAFVYEKDGRLAVLSPDWGSLERCRICTFSDCAAEDVADWLAGSPERTERLVLRRDEEPALEIGQYDREKLAYFLGAGGRMEDLE